MIEPNETALLPEGLHDSLVGDAAHERKTVEKLLNIFSVYGKSDCRSFERFLSQALCCSIKIVCSKVHFIGQELLVLRQTEIFKNQKFFVQRTYIIIN